MWMTCVHFYWLEDGKKDEVPMVLAQIMMMSFIFLAMIIQVHKVLPFKVLQCQNPPVRD